MPASRPAADLSGRSVRADGRQVVSEPSRFGPFSLLPWGTNYHSLSSREEEGDERPEVAAPSPAIAPRTPSCAQRFDAASLSAQVSPAAPPPPRNRLRSRNRAARRSA